MPRLSQTRVSRPSKFETIAQPHTTCTEGCSVGSVSGNSSQLSPSREVLEEVGKERVEVVEARAREHGGNQLPPPGILELRQFRFGRPRECQRRHAAKRAAEALLDLGCRDRHAVARATAAYASPTEPRTRKSVSAASKRTAFTDIADRELRIANWKICPSP